MVISVENTQPITSSDTRSGVGGDGGAGVVKPGIETGRETAWKIMEEEMDKLFRKEGRGNRKAFVCASTSQSPTQTNSRSVVKPWLFISQSRHRVTNWQKWLNGRGDDEEKRSHGESEAFAKTPVLSSFKGLSAKCRKTVLTFPLKRFYLFTLAYIYLILPFAK